MNQPNSGQPLVTIAIPTFNRADGYLRLALESALAQTYSNVEVLVADNASTDNTEELVTSYRDGRLRYIKQPENIGAIVNWNFTVSAANGDYYLMLHDDDLIDEDMIESCVSAANGSTHYGVIRTGVRIIDGDGHVRSAKRNSAEGLDTTAFFVAWFHGQTSHYLCNTLYNRHHLQRRGGFSSPKNLFLDAAAMVELAARHGRCDVPEVKASFRRHGANMGKTARSLDWAEDCLYVLESISNHVPNDDLARVRHEGLRFFCRKAYRHALAEPSLLQRYTAMLKIYRRFGFVINPASHIACKRWQGVRRRVRNIRPASDTHGSAH